MIYAFSPAKINLFLRVVSKREDGYHNLSSLFQTISLGDYLSVQLADVDSFTCSSSTVPNNSSNLVIQARNSFRKKTGIDQPLAIHLEKNIPTEAGLGGGSSNAATMLWAYNQLMQTKLSDQELQILGATLGSDVPFFFSSGTAYCTGRGENVCSIDPLKNEDMWIIKPHENVSTPEIFKAHRLPCVLDQQLTNQDLDLFLNRQMQHFNDLEITTFALLPSLALLKQKLLDAGFQTVLMSGSGSAFFCFGQPTYSLDSLNCFQIQASFIRRQPDAWYKN